MAATYDAALVPTSLRDALRLELRDVRALSGTTVTKPFLQDGEYDGLLARYGEVEGAARIAETIGGVFNLRVKQFAQPGDVDVTWPERADWYTDKAKVFRTLGIGGIGTIGLGQPAGYHEPMPTCDTDPRIAYL